MLASKQFHNAQSSCCAVKSQRKTSALFSSRRSNHLADVTQYTKGPLYYITWKPLARHDIEEKRLAATLVAYDASETQSYR